MGSNPSLDHSEAGHSKANRFELGAERALPVPSREASEDCSGVPYDGEIPDQGHFDSHQEQIDEVIWRPLQNNDNEFREKILFVDYSS